MGLHEAHKHTHNGSTGRKWEGEKQKKSQINNGWERPKLAKNVILHTQESVNSNRMMQKTHTKMYDGKNASSKRQNENLESNKKKTNSSHTGKSHTKWWRSEGCGMTYSKCWMKNTCQLRIMYLKKFLSNGGKIVQDNEKLRKFIPNRCTL